jgi:hypothetical protein
MLLDRDRYCDEAMVQQILVAAGRRRLRSLGEFGFLVRPYLTAGYSQEVVEAQRRYFHQETTRSDDDVKRTTARLSAVKEHCNSSSAVFGRLRPTVR